MARILFLDDCTTRFQWAHRELGDGNILEWAEDADAAIDLLDCHAYDLAYFDHDLGGETWQDPHDKNTGSEVVRWIVQNKPRIGKVFVHSMNTPAGNRMADNLRQAGYDAEYRSWLTIVNEKR